MAKTRTLRAPTGEIIEESGRGADGSEYEKDFYTQGSFDFAAFEKAYDEFACGNKEHKYAAFDMARLIIDRQRLGHMHPLSCNARALADTAIASCGCVIVGDGYYIRELSGPNNASATE